MMRKNLYILEKSKYANGFSSRRKLNVERIRNVLVADKRFINMGKGIYGLKEWGVWQGDTAEIVGKILRKSKKPLTLRQIYRQVSKHKQVDKKTILAVLQKNQFGRLKKNLYGLKKWNLPYILKRKVTFYAQSITPLIHRILLETNKVLPANAIVQKVVAELGCGQSTVWEYLVKDKRIKRFKKGFYGFKEWDDSYLPKKSKGSGSLLNLIFALFIRMVLLSL